MIVISEIKKKSHYISQFYLKHWSNDQDKIKVYERLVPNKKTPLWNEQSAESAIKQLQLYTKYITESELNDIETWFDENYETPVKDAYSKVIQGKKLDRDDWNKLISYAASQYIRTPKFYLRCNEIAEDAFDFILDNDFRILMEQSIASVKQNKEKSKDKYDKNYTFIDLKFDDDMSPLMLGSTFWIKSMKDSIDKINAVFNKHTWSIAEVAQGVVMPTSDSPLLCLDYYDSEHYLFDKGWNAKDNEIIFPLSSQLILYTRIGTKYKSHIALDKRLSLRIQDMVIQYSHRYLYSNQKIRYMTKMLPREVNEEKYKHEKAGWENWNENQKNL